MAPLDSKCDATTFARSQSHNQSDQTNSVLSPNLMQNQQVAQLWQGDRAKLDTFPINVQRYSQNHAHNWIFGPSYGGIRSNICALSDIFDKKKFVAEFHRENVSFTRKTAT